MKKYSKKMGFIVLLFAIFACFAVPIMQIVKYQNILNSGESLKFRLEGFDPYDAFRGRFVRINLTINPIMLKEPVKEDVFYDNLVGEGHYDGRYFRNKKGFLYFTKDANGYAKLVNFSFKQIPNANEIQATGYFNSWSVKYDEYNNYQNRLVVSYSPKLKLDRFYMNEYIANRAEKALQDDKMRDKFYALVKVKNSIAIIENIYVETTRLNNDFEVKQPIQSHEESMTLKEYISR